MNKPLLLVIDDDEEIRAAMRWALSSEYEVLLAEDRPGALEAARGYSPSIVTLDLGLPPHPGDTREGFQALAELLGLAPLMKIIVITGAQDRENALTAIKLGAYDFFPKPIQMEELRVVLRRALHVHNLESELQEMRVFPPAEVFEGMLGTSRQMQEVYRLIRKVAATDAPVLILGESGTGKELAARAVHRLSLRKEGPFIPINCGAIPSELLESELFGHEKGSFTGAHVTRKGRIEAASGGTLFLDEIGELSVPLQVKLLRFLQDQCIERVGGRERIAVDVRVLAATNMDLKTAMADGRFREDLYYRIRVVQVDMPPLREREGDVLLLSRILLQQCAAEMRKNISGFTQKAVETIEGHAWPGNVRELENRIRRAVIMADGANVTPEDLELNGSAGSPVRQLKEARKKTERDLIRRAIAASDGNLSRAAADLGISRPTLYELMGKHGISREQVVR
jgi:two-component system, NtrC family, response regulator